MKEYTCNMYIVFVKKELRTQGKHAIPFLFELNWTRTTCERRLWRVAISQDAQHLKIHEHLQHSKTHPNCWREPVRGWLPVRRCALRLPFTPSVSTAKSWPSLDVCHRNDSQKHFRSATNTSELPFTWFFIVKASKKYEQGKLAENM